MERKDAPLGLPQDQCGVLHDILRRLLSDFDQSARTHVLEWY